MVIVARIVAASYAVTMPSLYGLRGANPRGAASSFVYPNQKQQALKKCWDTGRKYEPVPNPG